MGRSLVLVSLSIAIGMGAFFGTQEVMKSWAPPIVDKCKRREDFVVWTGVDLLDFFLCIIVPFFRDAAFAPPIYKFISTQLGLLFNVCYLVTVLEAIRTGASGGVKFPGFFMFLCQIIGVGVQFPLLWIPFFQRSHGQKRDSGMGLSVTRVLAAIFSAILFFVSWLGLALLKPNDNFWAETCVIFQFAPMICGFFVSLTRFFGKTTSLTAHLFVKTSYIFLALLSLGLHFYVSKSVLETYISHFSTSEGLNFTFTSFFKKIFEDLLSSSCGLFLAFDFLGVWFGFLVMLLL